jgi:hypothetical protein
MEAVAEKRRGLGEVSSRHGHGPLFSMSWTMFYSAHMSIRHLVSFDVWGRTAWGRDFSRNEVQSPTVPGLFAWRKSLRRGWTAASLTS